jgi:hypothetical protein
MHITSRGDNGILFEGSRRDASSLIVARSRDSRSKKLGQGSVWSRPIERTLQGQAIRRSQAELLSLYCGWWSSGFGCLQPCADHEYLPSGCDRRAAESRYQVGCESREDHRRRSGRCVLRTNSSRRIRDSSRIADCWLNGFSQPET